MYMCSKPIGYAALPTAPRLSKMCIWKQEYFSIDFVQVLGEREEGRCWFVFLQIKTEINAIDIKKYGRNCTTKA